ncbi:hypothetical protein [Mycobacterium hubeiense]|uniref:hypothetical protein n=1 Tax=Mycobacterium hubeiense TaxID=1867256 RepID=UPI000C7EEE35|nr:hypothetical protein [Mycobacterium sp. QGD 101]
MGIQPDMSPYGSQTVTGPAWPNVDEDQLGAAAAKFEALAARITGTVVPQQQGQMMRLSDTWEGAGSLAATGEASTIIAGHEANGAQAAAIAAKLRAMQTAVIETKMLVNTIAQETQAECEAIQAMPFMNTQELIQSRIKLGMSQNIANVTANTTSMANTIGVPPSIPVVAAAPPTGPAQEAAEETKDAAQAAGQNPQQAMQMLSQMGGMAAQLPQQIGQMFGQLPQQLSQPLQQLTQPIQQMTSMFGQMGKGGSGGAGAMGFSSFSNHPLAGGSGAGSGAGMTKAASTPGSGGVPAQTPLMANLVGTKGVSTAPAETGAASGAAVGGVAPVAAAGGGGMGGMSPMMGQRATSGGSHPGLTAPPPLEYDLAEDDVDDDW